MDVGNIEVVGVVDGIGVLGGFSMEGVLHLHSRRCDEKGEACLMENA